MRLLLLALLSLPAWASASLTISGCTINTSGQWACTVAGASGALSPSSGVTGISLTNPTDSLAASVISATVSGTTLTVTTYQVANTGAYPIMADDGTGPRFSIATSSNLTDGSGNTVASGQSNIAPSANSSTWYAAGGSLLASHCQLDANPSTLQNGATGLRWGTGGGMIRCVGSFTGINILTFDYDNQADIFQDQVQLGSTVTMTSGGTYSAYTMASGLSGTHTYDVGLVTAETSHGGQYLALMAVQFVGGSFSAKPATKPWLLFFGASEAVPQLTDITQGVMWQASYATASPQFPLGFASQSMGVAGWPVSTQSPYQSANLTGCASGVTLCTSINFPYGSGHPYAIFVNPGGNDTGLSTTIGNYSTSGTFSGDAVTLLGNLATRFAPTSGKIYVIDEYCAPGLGTCSPPSSNPARPYMAAWQGAVAAYNAAPVNGVTAVSNPTFLLPCTDAAGYPDTAWQTGSYHLTALGNQQWAGCVLPIVRSMSGPTGFLIAGLR